MLPGPDPGEPGAGVAACAEWAATCVPQPCGAGEMGRGACEPDAWQHVGQGSSWFLCFRA